MWQNTDDRLHSTLHPGKGISKRKRSTSGAYAEISLIAGPHAARRIGRGAVEDLRAWLDYMRSRGLVSEVLGADPHLEVGAVPDLNAKQGKRVLLFDEMKGYARGFRILTGSLLDAGRVSYTLGCGWQGDSQRLVRALRARLGDPAETGAGGRAGGGG